MAPVVCSFCSHVTFLMLVKIITSHHITCYPQFRRPHTSPFPNTMAML